MYSIVISTFSSSETFWVDNMCSWLKYIYYLKDIEFHFNMVSYSGSEKEPSAFTDLWKVADRRSRRHDIFKTILKDNFEKVADRGVIVKKVAEFATSSAASKEARQSPIFVMTKLVRHFVIVNSSRR